jgi:hypothetical protein
MEDVGIFYGHLVHFTAFCYILRTFGIVRSNLVYFSRFWYFVQRKIWQPWCNQSQPSFSTFDSNGFCGKNLLSVEMVFYFFRVWWHFIICFNKTSLGMCPGDVA